MRAGPPEIEPIGLHIPKPATGDIQRYTNANAVNKTCSLVMASCRSFTVEPPLTDGFILSNPVLPFSLMLVELPAVVSSTSFVQGVADKRSAIVRCYLRFGLKHLP